MTSCANRTSVAPTSFKHPLKKNSTSDGFHLENHHQINRIYRHRPQILSGLDRFLFFLIWKIRNGSFINTLKVWLIFGFYSYSRSYELHFLIYLTYKFSPLIFMFLTFCLIDCANILKINVPCCCMHTYFKINSKQLEIFEAILYFFNITITKCIKTH